MKRGGRLNDARRGSGFDCARALRSTLVALKDLPHHLCHLNEQLEYDVGQQGVAEMLKHFGHLLARCGPRRWPKPSNLRTGVHGAAALWATYLID
jgi:hypothetical protein